MFKLEFKGLKSWKLLNRLFYKDSSWLKPLLNNIFNACIFHKGVDLLENLAYLGTLYTLSLKKTEEKQMWKQN